MPKKRTSSDLLRDLFPGTQVSRVVPISDFVDNIAQTFHKELLTKMGEVDEMAFVDLLVLMHSVAELAAQQENQFIHARQTVHQSVQMWRKARLRYRRAGRHTARSVKALAQAESALQEELKDLKRGSLNLGACRKQLDLLQRRIRELELACAKVVPPGKRTPAEKILAKNARGPRYFTPDVPDNKNSARTHYEIIRILDRELRKFTDGKVPSNHIDRFIVAFFSEALKQSVSEDNVKTIRLRLKKHGHTRTAPAST